jgi:hypothetical protein
MREAATERTVVLGRDEMEHCMIPVEPLYHCPPREDAQRIPDLLGDNHLAFGAYNICHNHTTYR